MGRNSICITKKAQALALLEFGDSITDIHIHTDLGLRTIYDISKKAIDRGYDAIMNKEFHDALFRENFRSG